MESTPQCYCKRCCCSTGPLPSHSSTSCSSNSSSSNSSSSNSSSSNSSSSSSNSGSSIRVLDSLKSGSQSSNVSALRDARTLPVRDGCCCCCCSCCWCCYSHSNGKYMSHCNTSMIPSSSSFIESHDLGQTHNGGNNSKQTSLVTESTPTSLLNQGTQTSLVNQSTPTSLVKESTHNSVVKESTPTSVLNQGTQTSLVKESTQSSLVNESITTSLVNESNRERSLGTAAAKEREKKEVHNKEAIVGRWWPTVAAAAFEQPAERRDECCQPSGDQWCYYNGRIPSTDNTKIENSTCLCCVSNALLEAYGVRRVPRYSSASHTCNNFWDMFLSSPRDAHAPVVLGPFTSEALGGALERLRAEALKEMAGDHRVSVHRSTARCLSFRPRNFHYIFCSLKELIDGLQTLAPAEQTASKTATPPSAAAAATAEYAPKTLVDSAAAASPTRAAAATAATAEPTRGAAATTSVTAAAIATAPVPETAAATGPTTALARAAATGGSAITAVTPATGREPAGLRRDGPPVTAVEEVPLIDSPLPNMASTGEDAAQWAATVANDVSDGRGQKEDGEGEEERENEKERIGEHATTIDSRSSADVSGAHQRGACVSEAPLAAAAPAVATVLDVDGALTPQGDGCSQTERGTPREAAPVAATAAATAAVHSKVRKQPAEQHQQQQQNNVGMPDMHEYLDPPQQQQQHQQLEQNLCVSQELLLHPEPLPQEQQQHEQMGSRQYKVPEVRRCEEKLYHREQQQQHEAATTLSPFKKEEEEGQQQQQLKKECEEERNPPYYEGGYYYYYRSLGRRPAKDRASLEAISPAVAAAFTLPPSLRIISTGNGCNSSDEYGVRNSKDNFNSSNVARHSQMRSDNDMYSLINRTAAGLGGGTKITWKGPKSVAAAPPPPRATEPATGAAPATLTGAAPATTLATGRAPATAPATTRVITSAAAPPRRRPTVGAAGQKAVTDDVVATAEEQSDPNVTTAPVQLNGQEELAVTRQEEEYGEGGGGGTHESRLLLVGAATSAETNAEEKVCSSLQKGRVVKLYHPHVGAPAATAGEGEEGVIEDAGPAPCNRKGKRRGKSHTEINTEQQEAVRDSAAFTAPPAESARPAASVEQSKGCCCCSCCRLQVHSTVLRVGQPGLELWTHYDVPDVRGDYFWCLILSFPMYALTMYDAFFYGVFM